MNYLEDAMFHKYFTLIVLTILMNKFQKWDSNMKSIKPNVLQIASTNYKVFFVNNWSYILVGIIVIAILYIFVIRFYKDEQDKKISTDINNNILFLAVNPEYKNLIHDLKTNGKVTSNNYQDLFKATRSLYLVSDAKISQSLNNWFNEIQKRPEMSKENEFDLDVYIVKILLTQEHPGFKSNASLKERSEAFKGISENLQKVFVSPRLSPEDYQNQSRYFYQN